MKTAVLTIFASMLMVLVTTAGCGSGRRTDPTRDAGTPRMDANIALVDAGPMPRDTGPVIPPDVGTDAFTPPRDAGRDTGSGRMCVRSCTTDSQCASSCPLMAGSAACCDLTTNSCYNAASSICPVPGEDGGVTMSY